MHVTVAEILSGISAFTVIGLALIVAAVKVTKAAIKGLYDVRIEALEDKAELHERQIALLSASSPK